MPILRGSSYRPGDIRIFAGVPTAIPAGFALADWRIAAKADFPRLAAAIGQAWRDGGDVYDTATHFRFPDGTRFIKGGTWAAGAPLACAYPLDAPALELALLAGLGQIVNGRLTMSGADQTGAYLIQGGLLAEEKYWALPAGFSTATQATLDLATGKKAIQATLDFGAMTSLTGAANATVMVLDAANLPIVAATLNYNNAVSGFRLTIADATGTIFDDVAHLTKRSEVLTFEFDATAGTFGVRRDGVLLALTRDAYTPGAGTLGMFADETDLVDAADAGKAISMTWRTAAADIAGTVTAGFGDGCGNAFGAVAGVSTVGTRGGSATSGGHALTKSELPIQAAGEGLRSPGDYGRTLYSEDVSVTPADAHTHTINPEHSTMLVLVKT